MTPLLPAGDSYPSGTYKLSEEAHVELPLFSGRDTIPTRIKHKPAWESSKSLGLLSNPMGKWEAKAEKLLQKSNEHTVKTMSHCLDGAMQTKHTEPFGQQRCMTYSLPVTSLSYKQLEKIQKKARHPKWGRISLKFG
jgi:hypothetical protein